MKRVRLAVLPALLLGAGLAACAPLPADPYYGAAPLAPAPYASNAYAPGYVAAPPAPGYGASYAAPMPAYVGQGDYGRRDYGRGGPAYAAVPADPYCREAYAALAGAQQQAAISGTYEDAARAGRTEGFFRRDC